MRVRLSSGTLEAKNTSSRRPASSAVGARVWLEVALDSGCRFSSDLGKAVQPTVRCVTLRLTCNAAPRAANLRTSRARSGSGRLAADHVGSHLLPLEPAVPTGYTPPFWGCPLCALFSE